MSGRWVSHTANLWKYDLAVYVAGWLASYGQSRRMFPCLLPEFTYSNTSEELTTLSRTNLVMVSMCNFPPILAHNCPVHYTRPVTGEIFGHNRLRSECLQVQPVTR